MRSLTIFSLEKEEEINKITEIPCLKSVYQAGGVQRI